MKQAVIVSAARTPVGKAPKGSLRHVRPDELGAIAVKAAMGRLPQLDPREIEDVIIGCAMPEAEQGHNVARLIALRAGLPDSAAGFTVNRFCASGLESIALAAGRIRSDGGDVFVAGGAESMSFIPMGGGKLAPNPWLMEHRPAAYMTMGLTAERVAQRYGIDREAADAFALQSHHRAVTAIAAGKFAEEIVPVSVTHFELGEDGRPQPRNGMLSTDEGPRADTSLEALATLRTPFHAKGTVTPGTSSQMSDGAAAVVMMSESRAKAVGATPLLRFVSYAVAGCLPEEMGMGPLYAVPKALERAGLRLEEMDVIELNEAFASQSLAVIRALAMDPARVNVNGGAIALGHPLGCTGTKLTVTLAAEMKRRGARYGLVTMCVGGGQGAAAIFENLQPPPNSLRDRGDKEGAA